MFKITKIRTIRWKTDERWSYEWWNDYTTIGYQMVMDKKTWVVEIKPKKPKYLSALILGSTSQIEEPKNSTDFAKFV